MPPDLHAKYRRWRDIIRRDGNDLLDSLGTMTTVPGLSSFGRIFLSEFKPPGTESKAKTTNRVGTNAVEALLGPEAHEILGEAESNKSADDRMRAIYKIDHRVLGWKSPQWAELLKVTPSAIRKTRWWMVDRINESKKGE